MCMRKNHKLLWSVILRDAVLKFIVSVDAFQTCKQMT